MIFIDFHHQHYRGFLQTQYLTTTCFRMIRMSTFSTCWLNQQQRNGANRKSNWQTIEVKAALYPYVPMIYLYHRLEMVGATLYYLLLFIAQAASSTNPPQPWLNPQRFDSLQRSQQGPPSTCKGHCHGDSAWIQEAVRLPWDLIIAVTVIRYE